MHSLVTGHGLCRVHSLVHGHSLLKGYGLKGHGIIILVVKEHGLKVLIATRGGSSRRSGVISSSLPGR